jgi:hypothetical protein
MQRSAITQIIIPITTMMLPSNGRVWKKALISSLNSSFFESSFNDFSALKTLIAFSIRNYFW